MAKYMDSKVFVGVIVAILLLAVGSVSGATITVDDSGGADYLSIQAAINNASGSGTEGVGGGGTIAGWNSTQVTNDIYSDQEPVIIKRSNGELFITFNSGGEDRIAGLYSTVSINNGTNWSVSRFAINGWGGLGLIEDANGRLISLVNDAGIYSWISSDDGQTWNNKRKVTPTSVNYEAGSIIQAQNGYYYVSYSNAYPGDVYTTRSLDLSTWENPVQVSTGNDCEFDSSLLQASDGIFYLAYNSYTDDAIVIAISNDGQTWDTMHKIPTSVDAHMSVNLIEIESKPVLFYGSQGILYYSFLDGSTWDSPQEIFSPSPFGADAVLLEDGSVGIAYANDGSQRDIFFTNLGKLNLLSSKPGPTITFSSRSQYEDDSESFTATVDQVADVTWILDGVTLYTNTSVTTASYYNSSAQLGIHNLTVIAENANGTDQKKLTWYVGGANFVLRTGGTKELYEGYSLIVDQIDVDGNKMWFTIEKDGVEVGSRILNSGDSFSYSRTIDGSSHLILQGSLKEVFEGVYTSIGIIDHFYQLSEIDGSVLIDDSNDFPKPGPTITLSSPSSPLVSNNEGDSATFIVTVDQVANVTWILDGVTLYTNTSVTTASYYNSSAQLGNHNLIVIAENVNGACERRWTWIVEESISSETGANTLYIRGSVFNGSDITNNDMGYIGNNGNGILEINASNFAGFHYDLNSNIGAEKFEILQNSTESYRTINENGLVYTTSIIDANYEQTLWTDQYQKICYFGEEYVPIKTDSANKLSKLLIDEKRTHTIRKGQSFELGEGYAITPQQIDVNGSKVWLELTKNGEYVADKIISVKNATAHSAKTWSYDQDMGGETDVVTLRIYVDQVFQGQIDSLVVIKGIWQISDSILELNSDTSAGLMEIQEIDSKIKMVNKVSMILHRGSTVDLANNVSIVVADSNDIRFHLSKGYTTPGVYEVRGEAHNLSSGTYGIIDYNNFAGFYYDLDANIGTESLEIRSISDRTISANSLVYTTVPKVAEFEYTPFGTYDVIGFMGDEYFAGYPAGTFGISTPISMISDGQLSQVLIDEDKNHAIYSGAGLILEEGYVLNIVEFDTDLEKIFVTLTKDGSELDSSVISSDTNYVYKKDLGSSDDIPIIAVHFGNIFQGTETNAVFVDGIFQISEWYMAINNGDPYGEMHVVNVDSTKIEMKNDDSILLRNDSTIYVMDKIYFKVADDSNNVRFYPFTEVMIEFIDDDEPIEEESYLYTMQLQKGWNLVSTPLIPDTPDVNTLFDSNNDVILPVYSWNTANKQYYNVNTIEISKGYWILALNDTQVTFAGTQYSGGMGAI